MRPLARVVHVGDISGRSNRAGKEAAGNERFLGGGSPYGVGRPLMPGEGVRARVTVAAARLVTHVHFLLGVLEVCLAVLVEVVLATEALVAHVANVRLVAAVNTPMPCQFLVASEGP